MKIDNMIKRVSLRGVCIAGGFFVFLYVVLPVLLSPKGVYVDINVIIRSVWQLVQEAMREDAFVGICVFIFAFIFPFILIAYIVSSLIGRNKDLKNLQSGMNVKNVILLSDRLFFNFFNSHYNFQCTYQDIERIEIGVKTDLQRTKNGYVEVIEKFQFEFKVLNGKVFKLETLVPLTTLFTPLNFVYKVIDYCRGVKEIQYKASGRGDNKEVCDKLKNYIERGCQLYYADHDIGGAYFVSCFLFFIGLVFLVGFADIIKAALGDCLSFVFILLVLPVVCVLISIWIDVKLQIDRNNKVKFGGHDDRM